MSRATNPARPGAADSPAASRSPLRWLPGWLRPGRTGLPDQPPRPVPAGLVALRDHPPRPVPAGLVALRDSSRVLIRPVRRADAALVADGFARLSLRSRQLRFLTAKKQLSAAELRYFTDVDHHDHEALVALNPADGRGVGIARYIRHSSDPHAAEVAVTIVDDWQGRGLGTELVTRLSGRARCAGIHRFTALVAEDNTAVARMLANTSARLAGRGPGTIEYQIPLTPHRIAPPHRRGPVPRPCPGAARTCPAPVAGQDPGTPDARHTTALRPEETLSGGCVAPECLIGAC